MTKQEQIYNWLMIGLQQPFDRLSEIFYYDKRDNEFFSILVVDYLMLDENLNIAKDTTTSYTEKTLEVLIDRIKRIEKKETTIISLPRFGNSQEVLDKPFISQQVDSFLTHNSINIQAATIWEVEESGTITIDLKNKKHSDTKN